MFITIYKTFNTICSNELYISVHTSLFIITVLCLDISKEWSQYTRG